jgi:peptidoglycan L-alanyl-D-glutamate endopeptidase CwlK
MGITQETLKRWRKHDVSKKDVKNLQRDEAWQIFRAFYWKPLRCDEMPIALALMTYNAGVNSGIGRGARWLQEALNRQGANLEVDGSVGPLTLNACAQFDVEQAVNDFAGIQESFLRGLGTFSAFGKGWMNRLNDVKSRALGMASEPVVVVGPTPPAALEPRVQSILEKLAAGLKETLMVATTIPSTPGTETGAKLPSQIPATAGPVSPDDILLLAQQLAALLQKLRVQQKGSAEPANQPADELRQLADVITAILPAARPVLGQVNGAFGETVGGLLNGKKSAIGILARWSQAC